MNKQQIEQMFAHPWPIQDVLNKLIEAAEILLDKKDYDGHGWEEISHCVKRGKFLVTIIRQLAQDARKESEGETPSGEGEIKKAMLQLKGLYKGEGEKMAEGWETELRKQFFKECTMGDFVDGTKIRIDFAPHDLFEWIKKNAIWPLKSIIRYQEQQLEGKAPESAIQMAEDERKIYQRALELYTGNINWQKEERAKLQLEIDQLRQQLDVNKAPESAPQIGWNRLEEARGKLFKVVSNNKLPNEIRIIIQEQISQISEFISLYKPIQSNK